MKKILLTFFVLLSSMNFAFAEGPSACPIEYKSADVILDYINNNNAILSEIQKQVSSASSLASSTPKGNIAAIT
jgi:hypothetical protein